MTRRALLSTGVCLIVSLAMWWGLLSLACRVCR